MEGDLISIAIAYAICRLTS